MDTALNEYSFDKAFFHMEDTSIFSDLFKDTLKYVISLFLYYHNQFQNQTIEWLNNTVDYVGVLLVAMLIQSMIIVLILSSFILLQKLQNSEYPILIDFYLPYLIMNQ